MIEKEFPLEVDEISKYERKMFNKLPKIIYFQENHNTFIYVKKVTSPFLIIIFFNTRPK